jgi:hypothetical protein
MPVWVGRGVMHVCMCDKLGIIYVINACERGVGEGGGGNEAMHACAVFNVKQKQLPLGIPLSTHIPTLPPTNPYMHFFPSPSPPFPPPQTHPSRTGCHRSSGHTCANRQRSQPTRCHRPLKDHAWAVCLRHTVAVTVQDL